MLHMVPVIACWCLGEVLADGLGGKISGPVIGLVLLFGWFAYRGEVPQPIGTAADHVFRHFALLFVPAGVGIVVHIDQVRADLVPIAAATLVGTLVTIAVTAAVVQGCLRAGAVNGSEPEGPLDDEPARL